MESPLFLNLFIIVALVVMVPGDAAGNYELLAYGNTYAAYLWQRPIYRGIPQRFQRIKMDDDALVPDFRNRQENYVNATDDDDIWPDEKKSEKKSHQKRDKMNKDSRVPTYNMPVPVVFVSSYLKPKN